MSDQPASPLRFVGVRLDGDYGVGDLVTIDYAGRSYKARVAARYDDYDDFGTAIPKYDLEVLSAP